MAMLFPDETVLPDDYPIYADYIYIVDGKPYRSDFHRITAKHLRRLLGAQEIRRCNLAARQDALAQARQEASNERR